MKIASPTHVQFSRKLTEVPLGLGLPSLESIRDELREYCDILLGRADAPTYSPYLGLAEIATAYFARAQEIDMLIHDLERDGHVLRGSDLYKFRTGSLRSFIEMSKRMAELGSRRLTQEQLLQEQRLDAS